jgi:hypothetical protein
MKRRHLPAIRIRRQRAREESRVLSDVMTKLDEALANGALTGPSDLQQAINRATIEVLEKRRIRSVESVRRLALRVMVSAIRPSTELLGNWVLDHAEEIVGDQQEVRSGFEKNLQDRWGRALSIAELLRVVALEAGMEFHHRHQPADESDRLHEALVRLHARACLIASEVQALLRTGHASGANARWRAMHELVVVAFFIKEHGPEMARRYLLHDGIESYRAAVEYQRFAEELNHQPMGDDELAEHEQVFNALRDEFGRAYTEPYGWAATAFGRAPRFREIEESVEFSKWRPYYRMASHTVHAGPKALRFDLGLLDRTNMMLAGPSNAGLTDPGHSMCISLGQVTVALLTTDPEIGDLVVMPLLIGLTDAAGDAFLDAQRQLEEDEARIRREDEQELDRAHD